MMGIVQMDKQTPMSLPPICAPREVLMRTFDRAANNQYIYIHAPAGYGKTISTLLWLNKSCARTIWISLDSYDNTLVLFYRLFCMSMLSVIPHDAELLQRIKSPAFSADPVGHAIDLMTLLAYEEDRYALVLDDFHLITNEEIKKSLPFVVKRLPVNMSVIILSRQSPSDALSALSEQQKLSVISSADLAFTSDEIRRHFAGYGRFITKDEAKILHDYTEGWIIALNALAVSGQIDVLESGPSLSFQGYIEKNIWVKLDEATRDFLVKTSVPDQFSLELCEYLTEDNRCAEILEKLVAGNINVSLIGTEYRYHNLFLEFLRSKLEQDEPVKKALNKKVAEYYLTKGNFLTAKNFAMKSGDPAAISQVVRSFYSLKTFSLDEYIEVHKLYGMDSIPEVICERAPILYVPRIFYAYTVGDIESVNRFLDKLYPRMEQIAETNPEVVEHINSMIMLDCRVKLSQLPARVGKLSAITHESKHLQNPTFTLQLPFLHRCVRDFYELTDQRLRKSIASFSANIIKENVTLMFSGAEAGLLMEQNNLHDALDVALTLKNTVNESMSPEFVYALYILIAELHFLLRQRDKYDQVLKEVRGYITSHACQHLIRNLTAYESRAHLWNGDRPAAEQWLKNYFVGEGSFGEFYKSYRNFTTVRAYILLDEHKKALDALGKLKALAERYDRPLDCAEADVLISVIEWSEGKKKEAQVRLQKTLLFMYQYGFIRTVANEGKAVLPILSAVIKKLDQERGSSDGFYKFVKEVYFSAYDRSKHLKGITYNQKASALSQLSPQQKRILTLLSKGFKNAEIVRETGLSLNTVRTHTKLAYQKLEVHNATDAILRAKELALID